MNDLPFCNSTCLAPWCRQLPPNDRDRALLARNILRAELMRHGMSYAKLTEALTAIEIEIEIEAGTC